MIDKSRTPDQLRDIVFHGVGVNKLHHLFRNVDRDVEITTAVCSLSVTYPPS